MAGFTDEIAHFNPYVAQIPTDDYINAGMMLQSKYDQGVARTQNYIDQVAGIQVAGEANSQYLRGRVTDLESKVSRVAGSDFSKNSVSSQVGQLASTIYRDPVIQAGVSSALKLQKYEKSWEDLKKDHPERYSDQNKEYFDQYVNDYLKQSQSKAGLVYNGPTDAVAHNNYFDKLDKQLKGLDPSIQTSISPAGEFMYRIDKSSTISRDQVDGVLNAAMLSDPGMQQQMQIDAWHSYRSFDAKGMFDHVSQSFGSMIDNYKGNIDYYQKVIKNNPNDYQTVTAAQKKILDFNTEQKTLESNRDNYLKAINNGQLDQVKQSVFNDSIRQGLILKYERNNITTDLHNNENAIEALKDKWEGDKIGIEREKLGIEREKLSIEWMKIGGKNGGQSQMVSIAGQVPDSYTEQKHNDAITNLQGTIGETLTKLRSYYPNMNDRDFRGYVDTQEAKYQSGDGSIDPKYAQFKSIVQPQQALLSTYVGINTKIHEDANKKFQIGDVIPDSHNYHDVTVRDENGTLRKTSVVADKATIEKSLEVRRNVGAIYDKRNPVITGRPGYAIGSGGGGDITDKDYEDAAARFKNDPNYKYIVGLAKGPNLTGLEDKAQEVINNRASYVSKSFTDFGRTTSFQAQPITAKPEVVKGIARLTATAASQNGDNVEADKINPVNYYNNDQGKVVIQYQKEKDGKMYEVEVPAAKNLLGNPDPYQQIARVIDISPNGSTPLNAQQALSSINGKVKYVLQKDPMGGEIEMRIWHKGALYTVPSFSIDGNSFSRPNIGSYVERIEQIARLSDADREKWIATLQK